MGNELVVDTLKTALEYIPNIQKAMNQTTQYLQSGKENLAMDILKELPDSLEWLLQVNILSAQINENYRMNIDMDNIQHSLNHINDAMVNLDYVSIADAIEYELLPQMDTYERELIRVLEKGTADGP